jgi:GntR family transcriptional repressor for pyruvate dehydrogenase complex
MALGSALWAPFVVRADTVHALFEVRKALEVSAVAWACERATAAERRQLTEIVQRAREAVGLGPNLDTRAAAHFDQLFHTTLVMASHNPVAARLMLNLLDVLEMVREQSLAVPGRAQQSVDDHAAIAEAVAAGDQHLAQERMRQHLCGVERAILRLLSQASPASADS